MPARSTRPASRPLSSPALWPNHCAAPSGPVTSAGWPPWSTKLFNIVQPDVAFFGQKDFQQCAVIRQMVRDLNLSIEIVTVPTVREPGGLALSSRNSYLSPTDRERARCLSRGLLAAQAAYREGERDSGRLIEIARSRITEVDQLQYLELRDASTLEAIQGVVEQPAALCVAAYVGQTRLIDNVLLTPLPTALSDRDLEVVSYAVGRQVTAGAEGSRP